MNKDILLNYVTGKIVEGQPSGNYNWETIENYDDTSIFADYFEYGYTVKGNLQCKDSKGNDLPYVVIYGYYVDANNNRKGFIVLTDQYLKEIQVFTQYSSGTDMSQFIALNIDEKGQLYGIDDNNGTKRFIMLNNIIAKLPTQENYNCTLRQSYNLPNEIKNNTIYGITKSLATNNYLIVSYLSNVLTFTNLEVVVGATNNWTHYTYTSSGTFEMNPIYDMYGTWGENTFTFKVCKKIYLENNGNNTATMHYEEIVVSDDNTTPTKYSYSGIINKNYDITGTEDDDMCNGCVILNNTTTYISCRGNYNDNAYALMCKINYSQNKIDFMYEMLIDPGAYGVYGELINNGNIIAFITTSYLTTLNKIDMFLIEENRYDGVYETWQGHNAPLICSLLQQYNLLIYSVRIDYLIWDFDEEKYTGGSASRFTHKTVFGEDIYARTPYESVDGLVPNYMALEDNNELVYARRLYNNSFAGNIMTSSVDIPNSMLNDSSAIELEGLYSVTNVKINEDNLTTFTKNMYEEVFVNVTTELQFKNDGERYRLNEPTILHNVFSDLNYQNQKISKCDIIYVDDTSKELTLNYTKIKNYYQVSIVMFIDKPVKEIRFKSEDGTIIYATNDLTGLQTNKIYKIKKDIWCNDKQAVDKVYYDNEPVYYDDEEVYY